MRIVRLRLSDEIIVRIENQVFPPKETESRVQIVSGFEEEIEDDYPPTLKDISTIMFSMVGHGVTWQLAHELSKRLETCKSPYEISKTLDEIFEEYYEMSEEQSFKNFEGYPKLYEPTNG